MPFLLGVLMGVAGFAMVIMGEVTLPGGRVLKRRPSRRAAWVWLSFFPLAFLARFLLGLLDLDRVIDPLLLFWIVSTLCFFIGLGFLLPAWPAPRLRRTAQVKTSTAN